MINSEELGENIRRWRKLAGITQEALAEAIGVARTTVVAIEKGQRRARLEDLQAIAKALHCTPEILLAKAPSIERAKDTQYYAFLNEEQKLWLEAWERKDWSTILTMIAHKFSVKES